MDKKQNEALLITRKIHNQLMSLVRLALNILFQRICNIMDKNKLWQIWSSLQYKNKQQHIHVDEMM